MQFSYILLLNFSFSRPTQAKEKGNNFLVIIIIILSIHHFHELNFMKPHGMAWHNTQRYHYHHFHQKRNVECVEHHLILHFFLIQQYIHCTKSLPPVQVQLLNPR